MARKTVRKAPAQQYSFTQALRVARAAGWDVANRAMKAAGRTEWSEDDHEAACQTTNSVLTSLGFGEFVAA